MGMTDRASEFPPLPPARLARWSNFANWETVYFPQFLGLKVEELRQDYARMRIGFRPEYNQPAGVMHGGVIATLVDTVVVPAIGTGYDDPRALFTIDVSLRFLAPIVESDAVAEGWIVQRGRSIVFCEAEVRDDTGKLAATASLTYKVSSTPANY
jgi:uncharacterized protein (TIGR00369 family)